MDSLRKRAGAVVATLLASMVCLELGSRLLFPLPEIMEFNRIEFTPLALFGGLGGAGGARPGEPVVLPGRGAKPLRNVKLRWISDPDHFEQVVTLNLYGFRGPTFRIQKPPDATRVLFVGDSIVEGFGAGDDQTIPRHFARALQGREAVEAINLGIGGTSLHEYVQLASVALPLLEPDAVFVVLYENDLPARPFDPRFVLPARHPGIERWWHPHFARVLGGVLRGEPPALFYHRGPFPFFLPVPAPSNPLTGMPDAALRDVNPLILRAMRQGRFNPFLVSAAAATEASLKTPLDETNDGSRYIEALTDLSRRTGARLLIGYVPLHAAVSDYYYPFWNELGTHFSAPSLTGPEFRRQQERLALICRRLGIPFVDGTPALAALERRNVRLFHPYDAHMNGDGYEVVARELARAFSGAGGARRGRQ